MVHPRTLTVGVTVNLDNYENLRVEVTDEAGSPEEAGRVIRFLDGVLASLGRGDQATAERIDNYRNRLFQTQSPNRDPEGFTAASEGDGKFRPGTVIATSRISAGITDLTGRDGSGTTGHQPDSPASDVQGHPGRTEKEKSIKKSGKMLKGPGERPPEDTAQGRSLSETPPSPLSIGTPTGFCGIDQPADPSRPGNAGSLPGKNKGTGPGPDSLRMGVPTTIEEKIPGTASGRPVVRAEMETGMKDTSAPEKDTSAPEIVCESCGGRVTPTEKKMSQLFASKTLCRRCMPRA